MQYVSKKAGGTIYTIDLPEDFAGGTVDVTEGESTYKRANIVLDGTEPWIVSGADDSTKFFVFAGVPKNLNTIGLCSHFKYIHSDLFYSMYAIAGQIVASNYTAREFGFDISEFKAYLAAQHEAGTPVTVNYEMLVPTQTAITPQPIPALNGTNTITTDAQSLTVTGRADPKHIISTMDARLAALEAAATGT